MIKWVPSMVLSAHLQKSPKGDSLQLRWGQWENSCMVAGCWVGPPKLFANKRLCDQFNKKEKIYDSVLELFHCFWGGKSLFLLTSALFFPPLLCSLPSTAHRLLIAANSYSHLQQNFQSVFLEISPKPTLSASTEILTFHVLVVLNLVVPLQM